MKRTNHIQCLMCTVFATGGLFVQACGSERPVVPPPATPVERVGQTNLIPTDPGNTPTASSVSIAENVLQACSIADGNAYFAFDSAKLNASDLGPLSAVAACFSTGPMAGRKLSLVGRADPRGTSEYNLALGQSRADAVAVYLTRHGMSAANASATSRGDMDATGSDEAGWAHDRRVDVILAE